MSRIVDPQLVMAELGLSSSCSDVEKFVIELAVTRAEGAVRKYLRYDPVKAAHTEYYPRMDQSRASREAVWEANDTTAYMRRVSEVASDELQLLHMPIRSDTAVRLWIDYDGRGGAKNGAFADDTEKTLGEDFWPNYDGEDDNGDRICRDGILRSVGLWPVEPGSVKVVYTAGYTSDEFHGNSALVDAVPIFDACMTEACRRAKKAFVNKKSDLAGWVAGPMSGESLGDYNYSIDTATATKLFGVTAGLMSEAKEMLSEFVHWGV